MSEIRPIVGTLGPRHISGYNIAVEESMTSPPWTCSRRRWRAMQAAIDPWHGWRLEIQFQVTRPRPAEGARLRRRRKMAPERTLKGQATPRSQTAAVPNSAATSFNAISRRSSGWRPWPADWSGAFEQVVGNASSGSSHFRSIPSGSFDRAFIGHEIGDDRHFLQHFEAASRTGGALVRQYATSEIVNLREDQAKIMALAAGATLPRPQRNSC